MDTEELYQALMYYYQGDEEATDELWEEIDFEVKGDPRELWAVIDNHDSPLQEMVSIGEHLTKWGWFFHVNGFGADESIVIFKHELASDD